MQEVDTLSCTTGITDYHDIKLLDDGGYILQCYGSTWVQISGPIPQFVRDILIIQEFDNNDNLIFEWDAMDYLSIFDYPDLLTNTNCIIISLYLRYIRDTSEYHVIRAD